MGLSFEDVHHSFGGIPALCGVTLEAEKGEILCLLGQSGSGKTTLLNLTAGVLRVQRGDIRLYGQSLASPSRHTLPEKRPIGLVFQEGALFPHMTVAQNIAFGVRIKKDRQSIVGELLEQIGLVGFADRFPHTLSGGQQQRVAVARALAPEPAVLLMDEPFASIDIMRRRRLREEIRRLLKARGCITIFVTHDPEEAVETADKIAVMESGRISQHGTAESLYRSPRSLLVGLMAGEGSVVRGRRVGSTVETHFGKVELKQLALQFSSEHTDEIDILLRPQSITLGASENGARIIDVRRTGRSQIVTLEAEDKTVVLLHVAHLPEWHVGQAVSLGNSDQRLPAFSVQASSKMT